MENNVIFDEMNALVAEYTKPTWGESLGGAFTLGSKGTLKSEKYVISSVEKNGTTVMYIVGDEVE